MLTRHFKVTFSGIATVLRSRRRTTCCVRFRASSLKRSFTTPDFAVQFLEFEKELEPILPRDLQSMLTQLRGGLLVVTEAFAPILSGNHGNTRTLSFMENFQSSLNESQQALLHRRRGDSSAMPAISIKRSRSSKPPRELLGGSSPVRRVLFGDFTAAGYAFIKADDTKKAIDAFSTAVSLWTGDFSAWMELARMQQLIGEHRDAVESYVGSGGD